MRIISMVPSWTETLIEAGIPLVGRTRFCIHPESALEIPVVGGTKNADWELISSLKPDLIILDREENPKDFSERGFQFWASHVTDGESLARDLESLSQVLNSSRLKRWARDVEEILSTPAQSAPALELATLEVLNPWSGSERFIYVIWRNPWMSISRATYIAFVMQKLGMKVFVHESKVNYPEFVLDTKNEDVAFLFSSEPYPFGRVSQELKALDVKGAIVDGEKFSWFGIRSIRFLREALGLSDHQ